MTEHEVPSPTYVRSVALSHALILLRDADVAAVTADNYLDHASRMEKFLTSGITPLPETIDIPDDLSVWADANGVSLDDLPVLETDAPDVPLPTEPPKDL